MRSTSRLLAVVIAAAALTACSKSAEHEHATGADFVPPELAGRGKIPVASFVNGDFEGGTLTGWTTETYLNNGLAVASPTTRAQLQLQAGGINKTSVKTAPTESLQAAGTSAGTTLFVPKYGSNAVVVNELGNNKNVNGIKQSMVITNDDVDPNDNKAHVRFALAPVLENPGHTAVQQPYFWMTLTNVTRGNAVLFYTFNYANQPGVPWKSTTNPANGNAVLYTDWQAFDISPGAAQLAVGDTVELEIIAAGCSLNGHYGQVYLDGIGAYLPGLAVAATAPAAVNSGATLTYTFRYSNNGIDAAPSTVITELLPTGTTFSSISAPGATCTTPAVGATGTVTCNVGTVNPASAGSFTLTVNVTAASGATINNGTYSIAATSVSPLIGPLVTTSVTSGVTYADLATTASDGVAAVGWGSATTYTVTVRNNGPSASNASPITVPLPANVSAFGTWTCSASGGAACGAASGSGAIATMANLPSGGQVTYTIPATVAAGSGASTISLQATASTPAGVTDNNGTNNVAVDSDQVGTLRTLTVTKAGAGVGTILSSPAAIACGTACASQAAAFLDGTSVALTASTAAGNRFLSWTAGPCTGSTLPSCSVPMSASTTVTASFAAGDWLVTGSAPAGNGTVSCASPRLNGQSSTCTITFASRYRLTALTDDGADVLAAASGGAYTIAAVTADHTVVGTFTANTASAALVASPSTPSAFGQPVTFTATVTAGAPAGTPTGTVDFLDGATPVCAGRALSGGSATCTTSALAIGAHGLTAVYAGDATYPGATSAALAYTVGQAATSLALAASPSPATYGGSVTLTATLSVTAPGAGTPTGTIAFTDGATTLCAAAPLAGGTTATCTTSALAAGIHALAASYGGDTGFLGSSAGPTSLTVSRAAPGMALATSGSPSIYGAPVTFTATLTGPAGAPGGTVTFSDGAATLCGPVALAGGVATCTSSVLLAGSHAVGATYGGDSNHLPASASGTQAVLQATPTVALVAAPDPSVSGQPVGITVTVAGAGAIPTGAVIVTDGVTTLCGGPLTLVAGVASCATAALQPGAHLLVATYSGDANYAGGTTASDGQTVNRAVTSVALDVAPAAGVYGQPVVLAATVTVQAPGGGSPGGTVQFFDGATLVGTATVNPVTGVATLTIPGSSPLAVGDHAFSASYGGDAAFQGALSPAVPTYPVGQAATLVSISPSVAPSVSGQAVTFSIDVSAVAPGSGTPTGTVTVSVDGGTPFGLTLAAGHASFSTAALAVGSHLVAATYGGDTDFLTGSGSLTQVVGKAATAVALVSAPSPSTYGGPVTLTATVTVPAPGAGAPTGAVTFTDGAATLCGGPVALSGATAICVTSSLLAGTHALVATYGGDAGFAGAASPARAQDVGKATPTVAVGTSSSPSTYGAPVTFTATVTGPGPTPTGAVTFTDGALTLCGGPVALSGGQATCTTSATLPGSHLVTASYAGDPNHLAASAFVPQLVDQATPAVAASAAPSPATYGDAVTLSATVTGPGLPPGGTVQFTEGAATLCAATLGAGGVASCASGPLAVGTHAISARYQGDADYLPATAGLSLTVAPAPVAVTLAPSANPSSYAAATTFTATVTGPGGTPGGQVTFLDGATVLCGGPRTLSAGGVATCTLSGAAGLSGGSHSLTASYGGAPSYLGGTSAPLAQQVDPVAPGVALATSAPTSVYGAPVTFTATLTGPGVTPTGAVTFSDGATPLCGPVATAGGVATCTTSALLRGAHTITATAAGDANYLGGSASRAQVVTQAAPAIAILASPAPSVFGQDVAVTVTVSGGGVVPTGAVSLTEGVAPLCGGPLTLSGGVATCHLADLAVGDHLLVAAYSGDANYAAGAPVATTQTVGRALTEVALEVAPTATVFGEPIVLTATVTPVAPGAGSPGGTVELWDGATLLGTATVDPITGVATFTVTAEAALTVGGHDFTVTYGGDASFQGSLSEPVPSHPIAQASTLVSVTSTRTPSVAGEAVTFTFEVLPVAPGAGTPSGTVHVAVDGGAPFDLTLAGGVATFQSAALPVGSHHLDATYDGDAAFLPSSGGLDQAVERDATAASVVPGPAPSVFGQPVTFTATVTAAAPGSGTPSGAVRLLEGGALVASGTLGAGGQAGLQVATLPVGLHTLTLEYLGDGSFLPSSASADQLVQQAFVDVALAASDGAPTYGTPVTFSVMVTPAFLGAGAPTGSVTLVDGASVLATLPLDAFGRASFTTSGLAPGAHAVVATYGGDASFQANDSAPAGVVVRAAPVTVALAVGPNPSAFGEPIAWDVQVIAAAPSTAVPDGTVQLLEGAAVLDTLTLDASGRASGGSAALPVGAHVLTARFLASPRFEAATSPTLTQQVLRATTSVLLSATPSPSAFGAPVTFSARVSAQAPGAGAPGGTVTFTEGGLVLGAGALDATGEARLVTAALSTGPHVVVATYGGDGSFEGRASAPFTQLVTTAGTQTTATATPAVAVFGQPVALGVTVTSTAGVPGGRVDLLEGGVSLLGSATLDGTGRATFTTAALAVGSHPVVASYVGDADHQPSLSLPAVAVVQPAATTTALAAAPAAPVSGQAITLTAMVLPVAPGAGAPGGLVTFRDGATDLGTAAVDAATHQATLAVAPLAVGDHAVTASYAGDGRFTGSSAAGPLSLRVDKAGVAVAVATSPAATVFGEPLTVTVTVTAAAPGAGTPTGQVALSDGATPLGTVTLSGGSGQLTTTLPTGDHALSASYPGDAAFLAGTGSAAHAVGKALTDTTLATSGSPSAYGQPVTLTATVRTVAPGAGTPDGTVTFRDGATLLGAAPVGAGGVATLVATLDAGLRALTADYGGGAGFAASRGTAAQDVQRAAVTVAVVASPSPAQYGEPVAVTVTVAATSGTAAGTVTLLEGATVLAGPVALDASGRAVVALGALPAGVHALTATYAPTAGFTAGNGGTSLTVTASGTSLAVVSSRNPSRFGRPVTLTASASTAFATPTGTVTFKDGQQVLGTASLVDGVARLTTRALRKGTHAVTAELAASAGFGAASATLGGGQVVENTPPVAGSGTALRLGPGHALRASAAAAGALDQASGTVELWARAGWTTPSQVGAAPTLARLGDASAARWAVGVSPERTALLVTLGATTTPVPADLTDGAWHQVALSATEAAVTVLLDGAEVGVVDGHFGAATGERLTVGDGFVGDLDELRVWSAARSTAEVAADARRPLRGTEPWLLGYWRMDEGDGLELFDGGPAGVDLAATPDPDDAAATALGASTAWRHRVGQRERPLAPIDAGYDADGDPLALDLTALPAHGTAATDHPDLQVDYLPAAGFSGDDALAFRLTDDEGATGEFTVDVTVERILACGSDADCSGGDLCAQGTCVAPSRITAQAGGCGCTSGGGGGLALWSLVALALGLRRRPRRVEAQDGRRP